MTDMIKKNIVTTILLILTLNFCKMVIFIFSQNKTMKNKTNAGMMNLSIDL